MVSGLFKILLILLLGFNYLSDEPEDEKRYRALRQVFFIVEILFDVYVVLPVIKRYLNYYKKAEIKAMQ